MKKLLSAACILTAITYQSAQAQSYYYEQAGQGAPEYIIIDGARYARIPPKAAPRVEPPRYELRREAEPRYELRRVDEPRYEPRPAAEPQPRYTTVRYEEDNASRLNINWKLRPFIGLDVGRADAKLSGDKEDIAVVNDFFEMKPEYWNGIVGLQLTPNVSLELFYEKSIAGRQNSIYRPTEFTDADIGTKFSYTAYGADLLYNLPLHQRIDVLFGLGVAKYDFDMSYEILIYNSSIGAYRTAAAKFSGDDEALRFGLGLQYNLSDSFALRTMGRYVHFLGDDFKRMLELSLGLRYFF